MEFGKHCNSDYDHDAETLFSVGRRFLVGNGVEKDIRKARGLLNRAAELGHPLAAQLLEKMKVVSEEPLTNDEEYQKMVRGEIYSANAPYLVDLLNHVKDLCWEYNQIRPTLLRERNLKLQQILGTCDEDTFINQPFYCDYGKHIHVGKRFFANFNLTILDEASVVIGDDCFIGPNVGIYTACHSIYPEERNTRDEWAKPVTIGNNCWIGGGVTILPGVTIGDNVTIGGGSVVVKDIPSDTVAVGNPAHVIKHLS